MNQFKKHLYQPNRRSMIRFLSSMIAYLGLAFHPDNYADEYIQFKGTEEVPVFTPEECEIINENLKMAHGVMGESIYDQTIMILNAQKLIDSNAPFWKNDN